MEKAILQMMAVSREERDTEWLKKSLQAAIELELSTIPPYLCAMWSIKGTTAGSPGGDVFKLIDGVVRQEMTHMGLVCNMLTGIGGTPQIAAGYASNIKYPGPLPGGVRPELTVYLSGLTKPYVHDVFMEIEFPENELVFAVIGGETFPTIGAFYDAIVDTFMQLSPPISPTHQLTSGPVGVAPILNLADVAKAIFLIKSQGEGSSTSPGDGQGTELAHYYRFAELYVGVTLASQGGGSFNGPQIPFPDTHTMAPVPEGGYPNAPADVAALLGAFNSLFSDMLDNLDTAWKNGDQAALTAGVTKMRQLKAAAENIMLKPLPKAVNGFYGPDFRYIPPNQRTTQAVTVTTNPVFSDIVTLLATLTGNDPNIDDAPHNAFWKNDYDTFMAQKTDEWGVAGNLVVKGDLDHSVLYKALAGKEPFGDSLPQMPDIASDPNGRAATPDELQIVVTWITNGCPK